MAVVEPKRDPPVARDGHSVVPLKAALEGVESEPGEVHALRTGTAIEGSQDSEGFRGMRGRDRL